MKVANRIHPTAVIGADVELGDGNVVGPYTVIVGPCRIGDGNWIGPQVVIGTPAEVRGGPHPVGWDDEADGPGVVIGDRCVVREFTSIHQGSHEVTRIGDEVLLLARSHVAHDCALDDGVTMAAGVRLAGHTQVAAWANIGMGTVVHQFVRIGPGAMIGMGSAVRKDVPPFTITVGNPARTTGVNRVGLSRRGCDDAVIERFEQYLKGGGTLPESLPAEIAERLTAWAKTSTDHH